MKDLTPAEIARLADVDIFDKVDQAKCPNGATH